MRTKILTLGLAVLALTGCQPNKTLAGWNVYDLETDNLIETFDRRHWDIASSCNSYQLPDKFVMQMRKHDDTFRIFKCKDVYVISIYTVCGNLSCKK